MVAGWLHGGRGVWAERQLECLDIPYTSTKKVHLPLRPKLVCIILPRVAGWLAGQLEFDFIATYLSPAKLGLRLSLAILFGFTKREDHINAILNITKKN